MIATLADADDFEGWRDLARRLVQAGLRPDQIAWDAPGSPGADLFAQGAPDLPEPSADAPQTRASLRFVQVAKSAILHTDPGRFALLYRLLWRLQATPRLMEDATDPDVRAAETLARTVRRDIHKMRAFLRFRSMTDPDGHERFVAWFEPEHHILRANAGFFVRRFTTMRWSILTPRGTLHWDGETLREGPPATRADAPTGDAVEDLWRGYYASIFNPARLKIAAMLKEMPRKYWKNMPEAALIPQLVATAQAREAAMVDKGSLDFGERPASLSGIAGAIQACCRCPIGCNGTRAVAGEGRADAALMIVGEQPGDVEEQEGRPFVGPAGRLLRSHAEHAGLPMAEAYVTNAVKHFKFEPRGKRRLHQSPTAREVDVCRWWLDGERDLVRPRVILALGASAARGLLGRTVSVQKVRGEPHPLDDGAELWITTHPSYLLRLQDEGRATEERRFAEDLATVAARLRAG
jgi:DNA polymerase